MRFLIIVLMAFFLFQGCATNSKNLSFINKEDKNFRITFGCTIPFDDIRLVRTYQEFKTTKNDYFVEFNDIYESYFEVTQTKDINANFSIDDYVQFIQNEGSRIISQQKHDGILYIRFSRNGKQLNQMIHANGQQLTIVNAEPLMFNSIKSYCKGK